MVASTKEKKKEAKAHLRHVRIAPRKARLVANVISGMSVNEAEAQLYLMKKRGSDFMLRLLRSSIANGENNHNMARGKMFIQEIRVDESRRLKRLLPRAYGRGDIMKKQLSHITIIIGEKEEADVKQRFFVPKDNKEKTSEKKKMKKAEGEKDKKREEEKRKSSEFSREPKKETRDFMNKVFRRKTI